MFLGTSKRQGCIMLDVFIPTNSVEAANSCEAWQLRLWSDSILSKVNPVSNPFTESDFSIKSAYQIVIHLNPLCSPFSFSVQLVKKLKF